MRYSILLIFMFCVPGILISADPVKNDTVLIRINGQAITKSEFIQVYKKNNMDIQTVEQKSVEEYLELYINFKLKVMEAEALEMHTDPNFIEELNGYRKQLARPYLTDESLTEKMVNEAFERMKTDIRASHILIEVDEFASAADTLKAWNRTMELRERLLKGESFEELARKYSDDSFARDIPAGPNNPGRRGNSGDLGYFTVFNMVYPFESAAYNTAPGELSMPVRTAFGYHLILVTDRLPAMGTARVAHIMMMTPTDANEERLEKAEETIFELYEQIRQGSDFQELARQYSEDRSSAPQNGEMPPFTSNRMVPEFIKAISEMDQPGQISQPVRTQFGWHIIRLLEKEGPDTSEQALSLLRERVTRDQRAQLSNQAVVKKLKKEYGYWEDVSALEQMYQLVDETIFSGSWEMPPAADLSDILFAFGPWEYSQQDFASYLHSSQLRRPSIDTDVYVNAMYHDYVRERLLAYEESQLEQKHPSFRSLMKEYHDGILLFELTDRVVWSKAAADTAGLRAFYEAHLENYKWEKSIKGSIYSTSHEKTAGRIHELLISAADRGLNDEWVKNEIEAMRLNADVISGRFESDDQEVLKLISWQKGVSDIIEWNRGYVVVNVLEVLPPETRDMGDNSWYAYCRLSKPS
jgi:peptidyl-prolyl cis-trans isomerase SurA